MTMAARPPQLGLVADIGGTNARFALTDLSADRVELQSIAVLPNIEFASLQHAIEHYLAQVGMQPATAALAVASPVTTDEIRLTNRAWSFSRSELEQTLGLRRLHMLNDFGAVAHAVKVLDRDDCVTLHGRLEQDGPRSPITVLGPGTGLGVALLVGDEGDSRVIETEGGHVSFAPIGSEEQRIARWLNARFDRVSTERLLSGAGLSNIDAALRGDAAVLDNEGRALLREPAFIVQAALAGHDRVARMALARFCAILGSVAGDAALIHGARTVMIGGGIVPRFIPFLRSSAFRERFLAKGRFAAYLESVSIHVVTHRSPGLLGAAVALRQVTRERAA
jgi:glucokinase